MVMSPEPQHEDETVPFWMSRSQLDLAEIAAVLHRERRQAELGTGDREVMLTRRIMAEVFLAGSGVEVGAGDRAWPVPARVQCFYGDVRDKVGLGEYFRNDSVEFDGYINAQTFEGVPAESFDFV